MALLITLARPFVVVLVYKKSFQTGKNERKAVVTKNCGLLFLFTAVRSHQTNEDQGEIIMVIILKNNCDKLQLDRLTSWLGEMHVTPQYTHGVGQTIMGLVGDTSKIDIDMLRALDIVEDVKRIAEPYKKANRKFHPEDTVITLDNGAKIGGGNLMVMAGPCSIESEEQLCTIAEAVKKSGATVLRGGAFKPRTSPYAFQGMREDGLKLLIQAKKKIGIPVVTEIMDYAHLPLFEDVDIIQVGARNMQNFELLKHLGKTNKPILLKRGLSST